MQVAAFIITTPIDGAVGKAVASWFGHGITEDEETAEEFPKIFDLQPHPEKFRKACQSALSAKSEHCGKRIIDMGWGLRAIVLSAACVMLSGKI